MTTPSQSTIIPFFRPFGSAGFRSTRLPTGKRGVAVIWGETRLPAQPIADRSARRRGARGRTGAVDAWRLVRAVKCTSTYRYLGAGSPLAASFLRVYVHETHLLSAAFLRAEGGGQHPSLVRTALPCREPMIAVVYVFYSWLHLTQADYDSRA